jgi:hypothetical protein
MKPIEDFTSEYVEDFFRMLMDSPKPKLNNQKKEVKNNMEIKNVIIEWGTDDTQLIAYEMRTDSSYPNFKVVEICIGGQDWKEDPTTTFFNTEKEALDFIKHRQDENESSTAA